MYTKLIVSKIILIVIGLTGFVGLNYFMSDYYFKLYPLIPLFFILILAGSFFALTRLKRKKTTIGIIVTVMKSIKFILCLAFVLLYCMLVDYNNLSFAVVFMLFYLVSLTLESWLLIKIIKS